METRVHELGCKEKIVVFLNWLKFRFPSHWYKLISFRCVCIGWFIICTKHRCGADRVVSDIHPEKLQTNQHFETMAVIKLVPVLTVLQKSRDGVVSQICSRYFNITDFLFWSYKNGSWSKCLGFATLPKRRGQDTETMKSLGSEEQRLANRSKPRSFLDSLVGNSLLILSA